MRLEKVDIVVRGRLLLFTLSAMLATLAGTCYAGFYISSLQVFLNTYMLNSNVYY